MRFDELPRVRGVIVEIDALRSIVHRCEPRLCRGASCCFAGYEVCVGAQEMARIRRVLPLVGPYVPDLTAQPGEPFFEGFGPGLSRIRRDPQGRCLFAYLNECGEVRCSLHSAALAQGLDVREVKPAGCLLWPLALTASRPRYLTVAPGAFAFPCNRGRDADARGLDEGVADIVRLMLGGGFLEELRARL